MQPELFRGRTMKQALDQVKSVMGEEAMILSAGTVDGEGGPWVEILATSFAEVEEYRRRMGGLTEKRPTRREERRRRPFVVALVGPAGGGKTLTAVKLALNPHGFGGRAVGFVTLDTYRVGGVDELQAYAEIAGIPLEVVYTRGDVPGALARLEGCEVVVVDTPGRWPGSGNGEGAWEGIVRELAPDETHLVLPASADWCVAQELVGRFRGVSVTHILLSKLDFLPPGFRWPELMERLALPARWVTGGQEVPGDLDPADVRLRTALGQLSPLDEQAVRIAHSHAARRVRAS